MTRKRETFPLKRFRSLWSLWQSLSYPFQQGTKIPSKQGPRSGLPWWLSGKESTHQCKRQGFNPCWGDPLEKEMATHSSILAWRIPWTEDLAGYSPRGCKESDTIERLHFHFFTFISNCGGGNEDNGDLLQKAPYRHCYTQCPQPCSSSPPTHTSAGDS